MEFQVLEDQLGMPGYWREVAGGGVGARGCEASSEEKDRERKKEELWVECQQKEATSQHTQASKHRMQER